MSDAAQALAEARSGPAPADGTPAPAPGSDPGPDSLFLHLDGFDGPLDLLLELARAQKVDLARISILALVEQYLAIVEGARRVRLELAADWLVMAAWLAWLKSRLLLPEDDERSEEGETAAETLASRLQELAAMRAAAAWLAARPVLGLDVHPRGSPESFVAVDRSDYAADLSGLVRAYLVALRRTAVRRTYRPRPVTAWTIREALQRLARLVGNLPDWTALELFLPEGLRDPLARRAALASTLVAGLEMARFGRIELAQEEAFGPILVRLGSGAEAELGEDPLDGGAPDGPAGTGAEHWAEPGDAPDSDAAAAPGSPRDAEEAG